MSPKQILRDYLTFTKKDRIGIYFVLSLILIICFLPRFFSRTYHPPTPIDPTIARMLDTVQHQNETNSETRSITSYNYEPSSMPGFTKGKRFVFDPNTLPAEGWAKLGLRERTIRTIINYRNKGGRFYKPEDLQKIWGLPEGFYNYIANYIQVTSVESKYERNYTNPTYTYERKEKKIEIVDINSADTGAYIALPGIGSKLANRIVNFRDKLGGFHSIEQIKETYGLPDSTYQAIKGYLQLNTLSVKKFNLNTATKEELKAHPYIKWQLANAIIEYRNQHGEFKTIEDLKKILIIDEATYTKISPYFIL
ncbi:ComEA family DNA-binding protein [Flavisolibacter tropicus]|uniref:Helix-hairpin-helix domain-containing protein n=1 Tax=Flavisolibacter tropicus TaxID=1492898 RepID=A0A172U106_9BACT|nr:helix-hairpin-helix domain-containing protein [Flavisolibacter tropicus]ANE52804.1 hypothetical protein SY85_22345 [Flavisolibacter tropicus]